MSDPKASTAPRLVSLDAYRGFIMVAMVSAGFSLHDVVRNNSQNPLFDGPVWQTLAFHTGHVPWAGCSFWDLIQPSFMFMVGVAMPYSYASRRARGQSQAQIYAHVLLRSAILVALGVFLSSNWSLSTHYTFVNVLSQIGLGYAFVHLFLDRKPAVQALGVAGILVGYWLWFALAPLPPADFDYARVTGRDQVEPYTGFFAHWNKNANAAATFDEWFLNRFPPVLTRDRPTGKVTGKVFEFNEGGYQTLNFIPSMATMLLGLMAGEFLRGPRPPRQKFLRLALAGSLCLVSGLVLGETVCPVVKRIWTPSWALYSAGWTFWMLAGFYYVIEILGWRGWAFPFVVVGMNSIAIYCMSQLMKPWVAQTLKTHFGQGVFDGTYFGKQYFDSALSPVAQSAAVLGVLWLVCLWLYRQRIFIRI